MNRTSLAFTSRLLCSGLLCSGLLSFNPPVTAADEPAEKPLQFRIVTDAAPDAKPGDGIVIRIGEAEVSEPEKPKAESATANPAQPGAFWGGKAPALWYIDTLEKTIKLSDEQKNKIKQIIDSRDAAQRKLQDAGAEKLKAFGEAMQAAQKTGDREAMAKVQKNYQEAYAPTLDLWKRSQAALDDVLTKEQLAQVRDNQFSSMLKWTTDSVELSADQRAKLKAAWDEHSPSNSDPWGQDFSKLIDKVLTPEQKQKIFAQRANQYLKAAFSSAKLTDEQLKKIEAAVREAGEQPGASLSGEVFTKLHAAVEQMLTDKQKQSQKSGWQVKPGSQVGGGILIVSPEGKSEATKKPNPSSESEKKEHGAKSDSPSTKTIAAPEGQRFTIILSEAENERTSEGASEAALKMARGQLQEAQGALQASLRERMRHQHELAERAWQTYRNIEALGTEKRGEANELREELERIQRELRDTLGGRPGGGGLVNPFSGNPVQPTGGMTAMPGAPIGWSGMAAASGGITYRLAESTAVENIGLKGLQVQAARLAELSKHLSHEVEELREAIEQASRTPQQQQQRLVVPGASENPDIRRLQSQLDELRRQMERLQSRQR